LSFSLSFQSQCTITFDLGSDINICLNDSTQLIADTGNNGNLYQWTPSTNINSVSIADPLVFPTITTTYFVTITDTLGCVGIDSVSVIVNTFNGSLNISNDDTICVGNTSLLTVTGALTYLWSPSIFLSNSTIPFPIAFPDQTTTFFVEGSDALGCKEIDSVTIEVLPLPNANAGLDTAICPGNTIQLLASGGDEYNWLISTGLSNFLIHDPIASPNDTIEYVVEVTDSNQCTNTDSVMVNVFNEAEASAGFNVSICANLPYQLQADGGELYLWSPSVFLNHDTISNPLAFPDTDMDFIVEVTDSNGCIDKDTVQILVFTIYTNNDTLFCDSDSIRVNVFGDPATEFIWSPSAGVSDTSSYEPWLSPSITTSYVVEATNAQGCSYNDTIIIEVSSPTPLFDTLLTPGCDGVYMEYENNSINAVNFYWEFSDGTTSNDELVKREFDFNTSFNAELFAIDQFGCIDSLEINTSSLGFEDYFDWSFPNVFTPNGDGLNDLFVINVAGRMYECVDLVIYNKWGEVQFTSSGNNIIWDGYTNTGVAANVGSYYFTISLKNHSKHGHLQLFR